MAMHPQSSAPTAKPILAAIDGSSHSHKVGAYAWRLASALGARLIVLGAHGHGPVPRIMLGSVGDRVAALSSRTVTIVR